MIIAILTSRGRSDPHQIAEVALLGEFRRRTCLPVIAVLAIHRHRPPPRHRPIVVAVAVVDVLVAGPLDAPCHQLRVSLYGLRVNGMSMK